MMKLKIFICITGFILFFNGCSGIEIKNSAWAENVITIDGANDDWQSNTFYVKENDLLIGFKNDSQYLYLTVSTSDRNNINQILGRGFIIWIDNEGDDAKKFGIKYPRGIMGSGMITIKKEDESISDMLNNMFELARSDSQIELMGPGEKEKKIRNVLDLKEITAKIGMVKNVFSYELRIALHKDFENVYGVGVKSNKSTIGVGFETTEIDMEKMKPRMEKMDRPPDDMGNERPKMRPGMKEGIQGQLKYWVKIKLASK